MIVIKSARMDAKTVFKNNSHGIIIKMKMKLRLSLRFNWRFTFCWQTLSQRPKSSQSVFELESTQISTFIRFSYSLLPNSALSRDSERKIPMITWVCFHFLAKKKKLCTLCELYNWFQKKMKVTMIGFFLFDFIYLFSTIFVSYFIFFFVC